MNQNTQEGGEILIIDDNPANLRLLFRVLAEAGWRVRAGTSGAQGLDAVESRAP
ncbi:MAG: response regulator, partial [Planctomycetes bacterium]|nr:response regulator [Planctomycetota bacterium]